MNPRKEFVNAIMSVLKLDQNVYVTASIEEIIDRIDMRDYTIFIAYLGERSGDFERPIQTIAKAVDEFYEKKNKPTRLMLRLKQNAIVSLVKNLDIALSQEFRQKQIDKNRTEKTSTPIFDYIRNKKELVKKIKTVKKISTKDVVSHYGTFSSIMIDVDEILPQIEQLGGLENLVDVYDEDSHDFEKYISIGLGIDKYCLPSISEKINSQAEEEINSNILNAISGLSEAKRITS